MKNIFVSASKSDSETSDLIYRFLALLDEFNLSYYRDGELLRAGCRFWEEIGYDLDKSDYFLALISEEYMESDNCLKELQRAILLDEFGYLKLVPILLNDVNHKESKTLSNLFKDKHYIRVNNDKVSKGKGIDEILKSIDSKKSLTEVKKIRKEFFDIPFWATEAVVNFKKHYPELLLPILTEDLSLEVALKIMSADKCWESCGITSFDRQGNHITRGATQDLLTNAKARDLSFLKDFKFIPDRFITRLEVCELIEKEEGLFFDDEIECKKINDLDSEDSHYKLAQAAIAEGLFELDQFNNFYPNNTVKVYEFIWIVDITQNLVGAPMPTDLEFYSRNKSVIESEWGDILTTFNIGTDRYKDVKFKYFGFDEKEPLVVSIKINNIPVDFRVEKSLKNFCIKIKKPWLIIPHKDAVVEIAERSSRFELVPSIHKRKPSGIKSGWLDFFFK